MYTSEKMDFADLYGRYSNDVFRFSYFLSGDRALADDIASEVFARALTANDQLRSGTVKAYLLAIARNLFLEFVRTRGRSTSLSDEHLGIADGSPDPEALVAGRLDLDATLHALQTVSERDRAALLMAGDGLSHEEIAAALNCSVAAARVRVHRARLQLRHLIAQRSTSL